MPVQTFRVDDFTGGLATRADVFHLGENESPDLVNVDVDPRGGVAMRRGTDQWKTYTYLGNANGIGVKLFPWRFGTTDQLIVVSTNHSGTFNQELHTYLNDTGSLTLGGTTPGTSEDRTLDSNLTVWDASAALVYSANSAAGVVQKWTGSSNTNLTANATGAWQDDITSHAGTHAPICRHIASHGDRMWVAYTSENTVAYPNRVRFSHPGYPESWRQIDYIEIVEGSGAGITALIPNGDRLLVFKKDTVHAIYGYDTDTFQVVKLADGLGVQHGRQVETMGDNVYFYSASGQGVFRLDKEGITEISNPIRPTVEDFYPTEYVYVSCANRKVWVSTRVTTYVFDPTIESWTKYEYETGAADPSGVRHVVDYVTGGVHYTVGVLHNANDFSLMLLDVDDKWTDDNTDTGATIDYPSYYKTRWYDLGEYSMKKMWTRPDFIVDQVDTDTDITVELYRDWDESTVVRTSTLELTAAVSPEGSQLVRGARLGLSKAVQLKLSGPGGKKWNVESINFKFNPRTIR